MSFLYTQHFMGNSTPCVHAHTRARAHTHTQTNFSVLQLSIFLKAFREKSGIHGEILIIPH